MAARSLCKAFSGEVDFRSAVENASKQNLYAGGQTGILPRISNGRANPSAAMDRDFHVGSARYGPKLRGGA
jgi:hypothetical protein